MTGAAGRSRNLMVRNGKGRPSMGDGGFPGKQLRGGWESLGLPSNCLLPPSVSLMVHMAPAVHYLFYMYFLTHSLLGCAQLGSAA